MDLFVGTLAGKGSLMTGGLSSVSGLILLLMTALLSVETDLLTGGDGDLALLKPTDLSSARKGIFGTISLSVNLAGNRDLLCLPEEQLLT